MILDNTPFSRNDEKNAHVFYHIPIKIIIKFELLYRFTSSITDTLCFARKKNPFIEKYFSFLSTVLRTVVTEMEFERAVCQAIQSAYHCQPYKLQMFRVQI